MIEQGGLAKAQSAALNASMRMITLRASAIAIVAGRYSRDPLANPGKIL